jgi:flagellar motor switch protein FliN
MDNDIPSPEDFPEERPDDGDGPDAGSVPGAASAGAGTTSGVSALLQDARLLAFGRRAVEVFALGAEGVVGQRVAVQVRSARVETYTEVAREFADADHVGVEVRFGLGAADAYPVALLVPFDDMGRIFRVSMSATDLADETFARGQVDLISNGMRELLDLAGLMLFIDELAGGEATLSAVRIRELPHTLGSLQQVDPDTVVRVDVALALQDGSAAHAVVLLPGALVTRLAGKLVTARPDRSEPAVAAPDPPLRAVGGSEYEDTDNISPLRTGFGPRQGAEQEIPVHPVRFPPLTVPEQSSGALQQMDLILDVPLRVSVELGRSSMTVEEVLALGPGSVIELNKLAGEPVDVLVNDRLIARGEVVVVDENFGVRVTEVISPRSRAVAMAR